LRNAYRDGDKESNAITMYRTAYFDGYFSYEGKNCIHTQKNITLWLNLYAD